MIIGARRETVRVNHLEGPMAELFLVVRGSDESVGEVFEQTGRLIDESSPSDPSVEGLAEMVG